MNKQLTSAQLWAVGAVLLCVVVAVLMWLGVVEPEQMAYLTVNSQVQSTETTLNHLLGAPHPAEPSQSVLQAIVQELPSTSDQPGLLTVLDSDSFSSHAKIESLTFLNSGSGSGQGTLASGNGGQSSTASVNGNLPQPAQVPGLQPVPMQLTVAGNYSEIEGFVQGLQHAPRLIEIVSVTFQNAASGGLTSASSVAQIVLNAYTAPQSAQLQAQTNR